MEINSYGGMSMMSVTAKKWGNSIGIRIPFKLANKHGVKDGTTLEIHDTNEGMVLKVSERPTLESLLEQCEGENPHREFFSDQVGREEI